MKYLQFDFDTEKEAEAFVEGISFAERNMNSKTSTKQITVHNCNTNTPVCRIQIEQQNDRYVDGRAWFHGRDI